MEGWGRLGQTYRNVRRPTGTMNLLGCTSLSNHIPPVPRLGYSEYEELIVELKFSFSNLANSAVRSIFALTG